jgi:hypothetical protein
LPPLLESIVLGFDKQLPLLNNAPVSTGSKGKSALASEAEKS